MSRAEFGGPASTHDDDKEDAVAFQQGTNLSSITGNVQDGYHEGDIRRSLPPEAQADTLPVAVLRNVYDPQDPSLDAEFFVDLEVCRGSQAANGDNS